MESCSVLSVEQAIFDMNANQHQNVNNYTFTSAVNTKRIQDDVSQKLCHLKKNTRMASSEWQQMCKEGIFLSLSFS